MTPELSLDFRRLNPTCLEYVPIQLLVSTCCVVLTPGKSANASASMTVTKIIARVSGLNP